MLSVDFQQRLLNVQVLIEGQQGQVCWFNLGTQGLNKETIQFGASVYLEVVGSGCYSLGIKQDEISQVRTGDALLPGVPGYRI